MKQNWKNRTMWTGDNLPILRGMNSESVDLIYLDPPFNSNRDYSAPIGSEAAGAAFKDTWTLDDVDVAWHGEIAEQNPAVYSVIQASGETHGNSMKSYLIMMAVRLLEMRRILKPTGSIYLHCDPTASHYLKLLMDAVFGKRSNFRNEIVWKRYFSSVHDAKANSASATTTFCSTANPGQERMLSYARYCSPIYRIRRYQGILSAYRARACVPDCINLANPAPRPNLMYDYKGYPHPPKNGWAID